MTLHFFVTQVTPNSLKLLHFDCFNTYFVASMGVFASKVENKERIEKSIFVCSVFKYDRTHFFEDTLQFSTCQIFIFIQLVKVCGV